MHRHKHTLEPACMCPAVSDSLWWGSCLRPDSVTGRLLLWRSSHGTWTEKNKNKRLYYSTKTNCVQIQSNKPSQQLITTTRISNVNADYLKMSDISPISLSLRRNIDKVQIVKSVRCMNGLVWGMSSERLDSIKWVSRSDAGLLSLSAVRSWYNDLNLDANPLSLYIWRYVQSLSILLFHFLTLKYMPRVRLELTTFRLWDWRAAYCANEAWLQMHCDSDKLS